MARAHYLILLALSAAALAACSFQNVIIRPRTIVIEKGYQDPHTDCTQCHEVSRPQGPEALFPAYVDPSKMCLDCHDYAVNHHPVNFVPATRLKPQFPLFSGEIKCLTCHEIHGGPEHHGTSKLLRGGPYAGRRTICFDCHTKEQYADLDPHSMMDDVGNHRIVNGKPVCLTCHEAEPDPTKATANMVLFKADIAFLCWRCHQSMHGAFFEGHFLATPSKEFLEHMNRRKSLEEFSLPLVPRGRITCSTCHNPHQKGVIQFDAAAAGADSSARLRDGNICVGCHQVLSP